MDRNTDAISALLAAAIIGSTQKAKTENNKENNTMKEIAKLLHEAYTAFIEVGFTEEQAFQLTLALRD